MEKEFTHGGKREGSGRKKRNKVSQHLRIDRDLVERLDGMEVDKSQFASDAIREKFNRDDEKV